MVFSKAPSEPAEPEHPPLQLSQDERRVLELHDQLRELEIRIALIKAQQDYTPGTARALIVRETSELTPSPDTSVADTDDALLVAQQEAAKAKASWLLRNDITDGVLTANPILKAVHGSKQMTPIER